MEVDFFFVWRDLGDTISSKRNFGWHGSFIGKKWKEGLRATPVCLLWKQWIKRNRQVFENLEKKKKNKQLNSHF